MRSIYCLLFIVSLGMPTLAEVHPDTVDFLTKYRVWPTILSASQEREIAALSGEYCRKVRADIKPLTPSETAWLDDNSHMQDNGIRAANKMTWDGGDEVYDSGAYTAPALKRASGFAVGQDGRLFPAIIS